MPPCQDGKIMNPKTQRCINIGGTVFAKLIKSLAPTDFTAEDRKKIRDAGFKLDSPEGLHSPKAEEKVVGLSPIAKEDLTKRVVKKVEKHIKKVENATETYVDVGHEEYCKLNKNEKLRIPLELSHIQYKIPYSSSDIRFNHVFQRYLDAKKLPFVKGFYKEIDIQFNNYNKDDALTLFKDQEYAIDYDWFDDMDKYIRSLSTYDAFTVLGYTYHSFDFINKYLIGKMTYLDLFYHSTYQIFYFPFYMQAFKLLDKVTFKTNDATYNHRGGTKPISDCGKEIKNLGLQKGYTLFIEVMNHFTFEFWKLVMDLFTKDLKRIIDNAPPVRKETVVYRGVKDNYFLKGAKNMYYQNTCFVSCTLSPNHAMSYLGGNRCCFKRITLLPGTRVLFISGLSCYPNELEIVVNVHSTMFIKEIKTYNIYDPVVFRSQKTDICFKNKNRKTDIVEIVVVESPEENANK
jgi:hypothetical protein